MIARRLNPRSGSRRGPFLRGWLTAPSRPAGPVLRLLVVLFAGSAILLAGCEEDKCVTCVDRTPPAVPTGVFSVTGDGQVTVYWNDLFYPTTRDLQEYWVYRTENGPDDLCNDGDDPIAVLAYDQNYDESTGLHWYVDTDVRNGRTYDYAIRSVDAAGNISLCSFEEVFDTPRPEGFAQELLDFDVDPVASGFDFSLLSAGRVDPRPPTTADIAVVFEEVAPGAEVPFVYTARPNVRLQDYGNIGLVWVDWAPADGWSVLGKAELIVGHSYIVEIEESQQDLNYAKFEVVNIRPSSVVIDWAYQPVSGSPELKGPPGAELAGAGAELIRF